jgi:hypothetical protein
MNTRMKEVKDWIAQLADSEQSDILAKQVQVHRASIRAVILPILYERLISQVRKDVARCSVVLPSEKRIAFVDGFLAGNILLRKLACYPTVDLNLELQDVLIKFSYQYRRTDTSQTKDWSDIIRCEIDSADMATLSIGDRKFIDERELSEFLLLPLLDANFSPPLCDQA